MSKTPKLVTIFGGSGFVGRYIARRMAMAGWRVRVAVRRPNEALHVRPYGAVGQVEPILANIRDEDSTRAAISGADAVINCVGILQQTNRQKFEAVHTKAAGRVARLAAEEGVARLVHVSAIGADEQAQSEYARTKALGESAVLEAFPSAVILRPSVIFGSEDAFFNRFAGLASISPVVPMVGAKTRFQPVFVDDVAQAAVIGATGNTAVGIYELGGPEVASFRDLMKRMLKSTRRNRLLVNLPFFMARIDAAILDFAQAVSLGLFTNKILTRDQVKQLAHDNVVAKGAKGFDDLGIDPTPIETVLDEYLYCFRPYGQYAALTESAENLHG